MPFITVETADKILKLATKLRIVAGDAAYDNEARKVHDNLCYALVTAITEVESDPKGSEEIADQIRQSVLDSGFDSGVLGTYKITLPPLIPNSQLKPSLVKKGAQQFSQKIVDATAAKSEIPISARTNCAVVFVHCSPLTRKIDYDNLAFKVYLDNIAEKYLMSDNMQNITLLQTYKESKIKKTEVYIMPKKALGEWVIKNCFK